MAFTTQKIKEKRFDSLVDLKKYLSNERDRFCMNPMRNFVQEGAVFRDDEYYGKGLDWVRFNEDGFRSFCQKFQLPVAFLQNLPEAGLATKALNNHLSREGIRQRLGQYVFVIDEKDKTVVGVVTEGYVGLRALYSNVASSGFSSWSCTFFS